MANNSKFKQYATKNIKKVKPIVTVTTKIVAKPKTQECPKCKLTKDVKCFIGTRNRPRIKCDTCRHELTPITVSDKDKHEKQAKYYMDARGRKIQELGLDGYRKLKAEEEQIKRDKNPERQQRINELKKPMKIKFYIIINMMLEKMGKYGI